MNPKVIHRSGRDRSLVRPSSPSATAATAMASVASLLLLFSPSSSAIDPMIGRRRFDDVNDLPSDGIETSPTRIDSRGTRRREEIGWQHSPELRGPGGILGRRHPDAPKIDYGGSHPYELMERARRENDAAADARDGEERRDLGPNDDWWDDDDTYDPSTAEAPYEPTPEEKFSWDRFRPIRIVTRTSNLLPTLDRHQDHNRFVENEVLLAAIEFWQNALMVYPVKRLFVYDEYCRDATHEEFIYGVKSADIIIYVTAEKYCGPAGEDTSTYATSDSCDWDQYDRPIGGSLDFCYNNIPLENGKASATTKRAIVETVIHEMAHILGVRSHDLAFFYDRHTGKPRTPRPVDKISYDKCIGGRTKDAYLPAKNTLDAGAIYPGIQYFEVVTPTVRQVARNHFNCQRMKGARLENQPTGGDCFGDHWEERLFWNENMSPVIGNPSIPEPLSPLTLALLEDSGWYRANYSAAEIIAFGHGAGCDFVEKPCIVKNEIPSYSEGYFCNNMNYGTDTKCDPSHSIMAYCDLANLAAQGRPPPFVFRYFTNPGLGAMNRRVDYCPTYSKFVMNCKSSPYGNFFKFPQERFNPNAKCFNSDYGRPVCLESRCDDATKSIVVTLNNQDYRCQSDGQKILLPGTTFSFECPKKSAMCPQYICPANCAGQGICNWGATPNPRCECFDKSESSPMCSTYEVVPKSEWKLFPTKMPTSEPTGAWKLAYKPTSVKNKPGGWYYKRTPSGCGSLSPLIAVCLVSALSVFLLRQG